MKPASELNMDAERAAFEAWANSGSHVTLSHVFSFTPHPNQSRYLDGTTELCWRAWQARAALASPAVSQKAAPLASTIPVAWRYQRDTQSMRGVPSGKWEFIEHGETAMELQGKRGYRANDSYHCWEALYAAPSTQQAVSQKDGAAVKAYIVEIEGEPGYQVTWTEGGIENAHRAGFTLTPLVIASPAATLDTPVDKTTASASDFKICHEAGVRCQCKDGEEICLRNRRAQAPSREAAELAAVIKAIPTVVWWNERDKHPVFNSASGADLILRKDVLAALAQQGASHAGNAGEDSERDAKRYRWLRQADWDDITSLYWSPQVQHAGTPDACMLAVDDAIDAAIAPSAEQEKK